MPKVTITRSDRPNKKLKAVFENGSKKTIHFGQKGASDYTKHKDPERKKRYIDRHRKNENWDNPKTAGTLSRYVLWNKPTLDASIKDYKKRFNLN